MKTCQLPPSFFSRAVSWVILCGVAIEPTPSELENFNQLLWLAHDEDLGSGDVTSRLLPANLRAAGWFVAREPMVFCGGVFLGDVARAYSELIETRHCLEEGRFAESGDVLAEWSGPAWAIIAAERVALNFLQRLSGIATTTRKYVNAIAGTGATICDTRKTTPGWRHVEKYAVRVGGGKNHRRGLYDAVMVKDNHLAALTNASNPAPLEQIGPKLQELRKELDHDGFVEVELDRIGQLSVALQLPVDVILLDNMRPDKLKQAVKQRDEANLTDKILLEASGGITLQTVRAVAETGVDWISIGSLTHSAKSVDIALDIRIRK